MTRTRRALWAVLTSYMGSGVTAVAGFLLVPVVLRFVTREEYGLWATIGQAVAYLALLDLGVGAAVVRRTAQVAAHPESKIDTSRTLSTAFAVYCGLGAVLGGVALAMGPLIPRLISAPTELRRTTLILFGCLASYAAVSLPLRVFQKVLYGLQEMARANFVAALESIVSPVTVVVALIAGAGLIALPIGTIVAGLLAATVAWTVLRRVAGSVHASWRFVSRVEARELFTWSWMLGLNSLAVVVIYQTDNIVVAWGQGLRAATTYSLTSRLPLYAMPIIFALADSCVPGAVELCEQRNASRLRGVFLKVQQISISAAAAVSVVAVFFNAPFMRLWVGSLNFGGEPLTAAFALILTYRAMMHSASVVVIGTGRIRGVVLMSAVEAGLNLGLSVWWVQRFGIVGVALATVVAGLVTSAWYVGLVVCEELRLGLSEYLWNGVVMPLVAATPAVLVALTARRMLALDSWLALAVAVVSTGAAYALAQFTIYSLQFTKRSSEQPDVVERGRVQGARILATHHQAD